MNCVVVVPLTLLVVEDEGVLSSLVKMPLIRNPEDGALSASGFVGGGVGVVGDDTGLVSTGAPFSRLALTSANHGFALSSSA